jgi:hypothetical protein
MLLHMLVVHPMYTILKDAAAGLRVRSNPIDVKIDAWRAT